MGTFPFSPDQLAQLALLSPSQTSLLQAFQLRCQFIHSLSEETRQAGLAYGRLRHLPGTEARRAVLLRTVGAAHARLRVEQDTLQDWLNQESQEHPAEVGAIRDLLIARGLWPLPVPPLPADVAHAVKKAGGRYE